MRATNYATATKLAKSKAAAHSVQQLLEQAEADNSAARADVEQLEQQVAAQTHRPDPVTVRAGKPVLVNRFMAGTGRAVNSGTPIVQLADCSELAVTIDAAQAAIAGFAGGQSATVGFAGSPNTLPLHLPAKLPVTGQVALKFDPGAIQAASGDACPVSRTATLTADPAN